MFAGGGITKTNNDEHREEGYKIGKFERIIFALFSEISDKKRKVEISENCPPPPIFDERIWHYFDQLLHVSYLDMPRVRFSVNLILIGTLNLSPHVCKQLNFCAIDAFEDL